MRTLRLQERGSLAAGQEGPRRNLRVCDGEQSEKLAAFFTMTYSLNQAMGNKSREPMALSLVAGWRGEGVNDCACVRVRVRVPSAQFLSSI